MKTAFEDGFDAYLRREQLDPSQSQEWQNGWQHAAAIEEELLSTS